MDIKPPCGSSPPPSSCQTNVSVAGNGINADMLKNIIDQVVRWVSEHGMNMNQQSSSAGAQPENVGGGGGGGGGNVGINVGKALYAQPSSLASSSDFNGPAGSNDGSLEAHVNGILADGRDHGFPNGYESYKPRIIAAMQHLREKGIVTSDDPYAAMQQASDWLMNNAGQDDTFSFGGGAANEDDAAALTASSGVSREDINAVKFMFDSYHDAQLTRQDNLQVNKNNPVFNDLANVLRSSGSFS
jgi:hypothetical protein